MPHITGYPRWQEEWLNSKRKKNTDIFISLNEKVAYWYIFLEVGMLRLKGTLPLNYIFLLFLWLFWLFFFKKNWDQLSICCLSWSPAPDSPLSASLGTVTETWNTTHGWVCCLWAMGKMCEFWRWKRRRIPLIFWTIWRTSAQNWRDQSLKTFGKL